LGRSAYQDEGDEFMRLYLRLSVVAVVALGAVLAGTARADVLNGACGTTAPVFSPWGDGSNYYFPGNGGFESGSAGWSLSGGATVVPGNESSYLHSRSDGHALSIPDGGGASVQLCYGVFYPALRFFAQSDDGATVHVSVTTKNWLGVVSTLDGGSFQAGSDWAPSPKLSTLLSALIAPFGSKTMALHIEVSGGTAQIDDLYVDPLVMRS
jgi:hypothetical protein